MASASILCLWARLWSKAVVGTLPPCQPRVFRRLRPTRLSNGPTRHHQGSCGRDRVHRLTAGLLDQWPQHSRGRPRATARATRPQTVLGVSPRLGPSAHIPIATVRVGLACSDEPEPVPRTGEQFEELLDERV